MFTLHGYSEKLRNFLVERSAALHARKGLAPMPDVVTMKRIGPEHPYDPDHNHIHARLQEESKEHPDAAAMQKELHAVEKSLTKTVNRWFLRFAYAFLLVVEYAGMFQLLGAQGFTQPEQGIVAAAGACILFYLTYQASKQSTRKIWFYLLLVVIAVFVIAIGIMRHEEIATEESSEVSNWASAVFLCVLTVGPGLLVKQVLKLLIPVEALAKNRRRLRRELKNANGKRDHARKEIERIHNTLAWHRQEAAVIKATYNLAYKEAGGKGVENPYDNSTIRSAA